MRYYNSSPAIGISYCEGCFDKQKRINQLEEVTSIRAKLKYRQDKEEYRTSSVKHADETS